MCLPTWHNRSIWSHHIEVHQNVLVALQHLSICKLDHQLAGLDLHCVPWSCNSCTNMDKIKLCNAPESNRAEIGPSELATKCRGKSKKGVSVCLVTLDRVALGIEWHVLSCCVAVSARAASCVVGCCLKVAAACTVLYVVGYYVTVTEVPRSRTSWACYCRLAVAYKMQQLLQWQHHPNSQRPSPEDY